MSTPWQRYVALGDSLTEGLEDLRPDGSYAGWADRLAGHLATRAGQPIEYANLAIRGRLLGQILDEQVEPALALEPDLVSLWGGGNDMLRPNIDLDGLLGRLDAAVAKLRAAGSDVLMGLGFDCKGSPILELTRNRTAVFNLGVWTIARRHGAFVTDIWNLGSLRDWRMWHDDRLHLSPEGHERVAQAALVALGQEPSDPDYTVPLPPAPAKTRRETLAWNYAWARDHAAPWIGRRIRRTSSGAGRTAKHPSYVTVSPAPSADRTAQ